MDIGYTIMYDVATTGACKSRFNHGKPHVWKCGVFLEKLTFDTACTIRNFVGFVTGEFQSYIFHSHSLFLAHTSLCMTLVHICAFLLNTGGIAIVIWFWFCSYYYHNHWAYRGSHFLDMLYCISRDNRGASMPKKVCFCMSSWPLYSLLLPLLQ